MKRNETLGPTGVLTSVNTDLIVAPRIQWRPC